MTVRRGRYALHEVIGRGGMATVHLGTLSSPGGFRRVVAIKRLHPELAGQTELARMLVDEAKLASRAVHTNVVSVLDVLEEEGETWLVMEHVSGETLARLLARATDRGERVPIAIASAILSGVLRGLHAAHEATSPGGEPLGLVHRDLSPDNVLVGQDGIPRLLDFGIARAAGRAQLTRPGYIRGKLSYMAPEQLRGEPLSRTSDLYAAAVVLWELATGKRLFEGDSPAVVEALVLGGPVTPPSQAAEGVPPCLDRVVLRGLARDPSLRFESGQQMAEALERCVAPAPPAEVAAWVAGLATEELAERARLVAEVEQRPEAAATATAPALPTAATRPPRFAIPAGVALVTAPPQQALGRGSSPRPDANANANADADADANARTNADANAGADAGANAAADASASVPPDAGRAAVRVRRAADAGARPTPTPPPDACNPPWVIDEVGHRRFKRECL